MRSKEANLSWKHYRHSPVRPYYRVTVDDSNDLSLVRAIHASLSPLSPDFGVGEVVEYLEANPQLAALNLATVRNEGFLNSQSVEKKQTKLVMTFKQILGGKCFGVVQNGLFQVEICFCPSELKCFFPTIGLLTLLVLKAAGFGTLMDVSL